MNKKPQICAVGMFNLVFDIQLKSLMDVFSKNGIESIKTTYYQNKILKFFGVLFFLFVNLKKYDVIHIQAHSRFNIISVVIAVIWAKVLRKKIVMMYYGGAAKEFFSIAPIVFKKIFTQIDQIVVAGNYVQSAFTQLGIKSIIIPHVIDEKRWVYRHRESTENHLLWIRHLLKEYNPILVLRVFEKLKLRVPGLKLKIVGTGDLQGTMEEYIIAHALTDIEMKGRVTHEKLKYLFNWSNIFINTTNVDNQPVSVLEAMICGCPVVSTNPGGIPDIITHGETGMLSNPGDVDAMVENLIYLMENRKVYSRISKMGRKFVQNTFGKDIIYKQWSVVYAKMGFSL